MKVKEIDMKTATLWTKIKAWFERQVRHVCMPTHERELEWMGEHGYPLPVIENRMRDQLRGGGFENNWPRR